MAEKSRNNTVYQAIIPAAVLLLFIAGFIGIAAASGAAVSETEVTITSAATVGIVTLEDENGDTIATGMIGPSAEPVPVVLTYNPAEHHLASVSILGAGYFPAAVSAENPPAGSHLAVEFFLSSEDETAGYGKVTVVPRESAKDTAAETPAPVAGILAGLAGAAALFIGGRRM